MNKPAIAAWGVIVLAAVGSLTLLNTCTPRDQDAPRVPLIPWVARDEPVKQDAPRVPPIAERIHEPEAPLDHIASAGKLIHKHLRAETCVPNGIDCGAILKVRDLP